MHILIPEDLARDLIENRYARAAGRPRGGVLEWVISGASHASVWVTILQTPATVHFFATWLQQRARRGGDALSIRVSGPRGTLEMFDVRGDEDISQIVRDVSVFLSD